MTVTTEIQLEALDELADRLPEPGSVDVTIEVMGADIGDQMAAQKLPWHALIVDRSTIEISVGGRDHSVPVVLRHEIHEPRSVWVEEVAGAIVVISIEDREGVKTLVRFHERQKLGGGD
jgi:hypothetical protein